MYTNLRIDAASGIGAGANSFTKSVNHRQLVASLEQRNQESNASPGLLNAGNLSTVTVGNPASPYHSGAKSTNIHRVTSPGRNKNLQFRSLNPH